VNPRPDEPVGPQDPGGPDDPADAEPTGPAPDPDAAFRAIVAGFGRPSDSPVPPWPVEEDVDEPRRRASDQAPQPPRGPLPPPPPGDLPGWVEPAALEDGHHYVPPPPPPAPRARPRTLAAAAAIALGVVLLFAPSLLDVAPGPGTSFLGMLLTGGGAGALVYWMRDAPGHEGPDDGAVV
jgi:hypothetical protein